jgi:hypothetical protein
MAASAVITEFDQLRAAERVWPLGADGPRLHCGEAAGRSLGIVSRGCPPHVGQAEEVDLG